MNELLSSLLMNTEWNIFFSALLYVLSLLYVLFLQACFVQTPQGQEYEGRRFSGKGVHLCVCSFSVFKHSFPQLGIFFIKYLIEIIVFEAAPVLLSPRSQVCPFFWPGRPWSLLWELCAKTSVLARFWSRLI